MSLSNRRADRPIAELRRAIAARPPRAYEYLEIAPKPSLVEAVTDARRRIEHGHGFSKHSAFSIVTPIDWEFGLRSANFHVHAFLPINSQIVAYDLSKRRRFLRVASAFVFDWIEHNIEPVLTIADAHAIDACLADPHLSRWFDMAVGQRLHKMAYLLDILARDAAIKDERIARIADAITLHHRLLADPRLYRPQNNHGFYQAITQYAAATRLPELDDEGFAALSRRRLAEMIDRQFLADDFHAEHSPGYHHMVTVTLINARNAGMLDSELTTRIARLEDTHSRLIKPDGHIATIGDTDPRAFWNMRRYAGFFEDPALRYIVSGGREGEPPAPGVESFQHSGYAVARLDPIDGKRTGFRRQSYLIQQAGFHSRAHKQADHLSFVWHEYGRDILTDPARFAYAGRTAPGTELFTQGFFYSDPKRVYVESTRAHNCVEIDGRSHRRMGTPFFGSALRRVESQGELAVFATAISHDETISHRRTLILRPGHFLLVFDRLEDSAGAPHDFRQWFCVAPQWRVTAAGGGLRGVAVSEGRRRKARFTAVSLNRDAAWDAPVSGQTEPELLGWISNRASHLVPATSLCLPSLGTARTWFATMFALSRTCVVDREQTRFDAAADAGETRWRDDRGEHRLVLGTDGEGALGAVFERVGGDG